MAVILVAEDESHILLLIQRKLELAGFSIRATTDGEEAMALALNEKPDLLLLDIGLPGRSGLEICEAVKTAFGDEAPPVILISARGQPIDVDTGRQVGADDYIIKPFSPGQLLARVENALLR